MAWLLVLIGSAATAVLLWDPSPTTERRFDRAENGIWLGHKWYTGHSVRTAEPVPAIELVRLKENLDRHGITDLFIHVGPARSDGTLEDEPGRVFADLRKAFPASRLLAWVGARVEGVPLEEAKFHENLIESLVALDSAGFDGVHFDFEPMADFEPGYLELLSRVRDEMGPEFVISQATPRASLFGLPPGPLRRSFWSKDFYLETMRRSDQTVLMAYDSRFNYIKAYMTFVRHQSGLLADWACSIPGHELLVGLPSYEDVPLYSNPKVENLRTASLGVRAAVEQRSEREKCVVGVAIYSNWVTDEDEWRDFRSYWMDPGSEPQG
jgi:hypothetical protein